MFHTEGGMPWDFPPLTQISPLKLCQLYLYFVLLSHPNGITSSIYLSLKQWFCMKHWLSIGASQFRRGISDNVVFQYFSTVLYQELECHKAPVSTYLIARNCGEVFNLANLIKIAKLRTRQFRLMHTCLWHYEFSSPNTKFKFCQYQLRADSPNLMLTEVSHYTIYTLEKFLGGKSLTSWGGVCGKSLYS